MKLQPCTTITFAAIFLLPLVAVNANNNGTGGDSIFDNMSGSSSDICFPPQFESLALATLSTENVYIAADYDRGFIYMAPSNASDVPSWYLSDLNVNRTYYWNKYQGCSYTDMDAGGVELFAQCLPEHAYYIRSIDDHDLYLVAGPTGNNRVSGVTKLGDTGYYQSFVTRLSSRGNLLDVYVFFETTMGLSDPTVFDKNVTNCFPYFG